MGKSPSLIISEEDYHKISSLLLNIKTEIAELLEEELGRATLVPASELPDNVVSMNSEVSFVDLDTNKEQTVTLVYPNEADIEKSKISIFAPVGAALIGLQIGQSIDWPLPDGKDRHVKVISLVRPDLSNIK